MYSIFITRLIYSDIITTAGKSKKWHNFLIWRSHSKLSTQDYLKILMFLLCFYLSSLFININKYLFIIIFYYLQFLLPNIMFRNAMNIDKIMFFFLQIKGIIISVDRFLNNLCNQLYVYFQICVCIYIYMYIFTFLIFWSTLV